MPVGVRAPRPVRPGATSGRKRVQPVVSVRRLEMAAPSPTGWATTTGPRSPAPSRSGRRRQERRPVGLVAALLARPPWPWAARSGDGVERVVGRRAPLEPEPHEVHADERGRDGPGVVDGPHLLVADGDAVLVDPVLEPPHPGRLGAEQGGGPGVGDRHVGGLHGLLAGGTAPEPPQHWTSSTGRSLDLAKSMPPGRRTRCRTRWRSRSAPARRAPRRPPHPLSIAPSIAGPPLGGLDPGPVGAADGDHSAGRRRSGARRQVGAVAARVRARPTSPGRCSADVAGRSPSVRASVDDVAALLGSGRRRRRRRGPRRTR